MDEIRNMHKLKTELAINDEEIFGGDVDILDNSTEIESNKTNKSGLKAPDSVDWRE